MQHFVNFGLGEFGAVRAANKAKKAFVTNMLSDYPYTNPEYAAKEVRRQVRDGKPIDNSRATIENMQYGRKALKTVSTKNSEIQDRTTSPVIAGQPNYDYPVNNNAKMDLVIKRNNRKIVDSVTGNDPKKRLSNRNLISDLYDYAPSHSFLSAKEAKDLSNHALQTARVERNQMPNVPLKPIMQSSERFDFAPNRKQLGDVYEKNYAKENQGANRYDPKLVTGSDNHTWLTGDGKYMEIPIGQQEMPLNASMWKGRKSGYRLPDQEVKGIGEIGSPVKGVSGKLFKGYTNDQDMSHRLTRTADNYNSQVANKRYVPTE